MKLKFWKTRRARAPRKMIGPYRIKREIGRGSMGIVYLGADPVSGRDVAIKAMVVPDDIDDATLHDTRSRFLRETTILNWLDHPDIVAIHDFGEEHGLSYFVMEFLKGVELSEHTMTRRLLPLSKTLEITARVADALAHAHEQNVTHRDIKPANIMYHAASNMVKVMDFGVSRLTNFSMTQHGIVLGSPVYMSPEQVLGQELDGRSDLFSLGTTFYQLLAGVLPFAGDSEFEVMRHIAEEPHLDILAARRDLPQAVRAVVNRALTKDIERRYQTGYEMAAAIRDCAATLK